MSHRHKPLQRDRVILLELFALELGEEIELYNCEGEQVYLRRVPAPVRPVPAKPEPAPV